MKKLFSFLLIVVLISCSKDPVIYTLTATANPAEGGTVSPSSQQYDSGDVAAITATPSPEYVFQSWSGSASGTSPSTTVTMNSDKAVVANFIKKKYPLTLNVEGEGSVTEKVIKAGVARDDYNSGTIVELTAVPGGEWLFVEWTGDLTGSENPKQITIDKAKTVTAVFVKKQYALTIEIEGEGSVTEKVIKAGAARNDYNSGTIVELTAVPTGDWEFVEWTGDITSTENPVQITIDGPKTVKAKFKREYNYLTTWDKIKNYPKKVIRYSDLNYYPDCGFDTTSIMADFNNDGYIDVFLSPQCSDDDQRQPPSAIFLNKNGEFIKSDINISNNIGLWSGTRQTIVGDFNNDNIPDLFFAAHNGHGYDGGKPSIQLSNSNGFEYKDLDIPKGWYSFGSGGDVDNDGDLDIIVSGREYGLFINNGDGSFNFKFDFILNYDGKIGVTSLIDFNNDGFLDLVFRNGDSHDSHFIVLNSNGVFDFNNSIALPMHTAEGPDLDDDPIKDGIQVLDIQDRVVYDIDNDGDYDIITASFPHDGSNPPNMGGGYYFQVLENRNLKFYDVTDQLFVEPYAPKYVEWLRINDYDDDGFLELYESQQKDNWFVRRWDGSKFQKIN